MKFIHLADVHFDTLFTLLNSKGVLGEKRRLEQRKIFEKVIEKIKEEKIEYLFISGDLYEQKYIKKSTIDFVNKKFNEIPETIIFISPGNHDPYLKNSYYNTYEWGENVHIFGEKLEKVATNSANIYGFGFEDYESKCLELKTLKLNKTDEKPNILIIHGSLDASDKSEKTYNPLSSNELKALGFDYIALGHIHKNNIETGKNIIYPGSLVAQGFDELGEHGVVYGEIVDKELKLEFIKMDDTEFFEEEIDITGITSVEELIEKINEIEENENKYYKIILVGDRNFEINLLEIMKFITNYSVLKIKDKTKLKYNLEEIAKENTLKGVFTQSILDKMQTEEYDKEMLEKALEIGLELL